MQRFSNISIKNKLIFIQSITAFLAVLLCAVVFVVNDINIFKENAVRKLYSVARIVGGNIVAPLEFSDKNIAQEILQSLDKEPDIKEAMVLDTAGDIFARYTRPGAEIASFPNTRSSQIIYSEFSGRKLLVTYRIYHEDEFLGIIIIKAELTDLNTIITSYILIAAIVLLAGLLAAVIISNFLQNVISGRLLKLVSKTKEVAETGNYSIRVAPEGKDEITTLSLGFNNMLEQIKKMEEVLKGTNIELEKRVKTRTAELETTNKKLEATSEELKHSNSELEQFAYVASHDLQEPLRTIANFVGLVNMKYAGKLDADADKYLGYIVNATTKMQNLIKDLLEFSRIGSSIAFTEVDTAKVLESVTEEISTTIKETGAEITSGNLPVLTANIVELKRLLQNLITNAIKFRKKDATPHVHISAEENKFEYHFTVKDNGIGIEEEYKERIFIIFQRLHTVAEYPGTGIGLATCKKIVALHNGKIWVESKPGEGSQFHFTISKTIVTDKA